MDSDEALFDRLCAGDLGAFDRLYARFERPLHAFIRSQLRDATEAEDVLHEAFMAVLKARKDRHTVRSFRAWLYGVAHHLCLNRARSRRRADAAFDTAVPSEPAARADHALEAAEQVARLATAVERLPRALGELYRLRASGLSYAEVAGVLDVPVGTVKSRMHDLVARLREEMNR